MNERELIEAARRHQVRVYGLSRYYSSPPVQTDEGTLLLGFATLNIKEIPEAVARLKKAWAAGLENSNPARPYID
jgi:GntR family transcriptional regulator/MocR family aminotransferase